MRVIYPSETSACLLTTRRYNPEDALSTRYKCSILPEFKDRRCVCELPGRGFADRTRCSKEQHPEMTRAPLARCAVYQSASLNCLTVTITVRQGCLPATSVSLNPCLSLTDLKHPFLVSTKCYLLNRHLCHYVIYTSSLNKPRKSQQMYSNITYI
jgi:hypothetical protein